MRVGFVLGYGEDVIVRYIKKMEARKAPSGIPYMEVTTAPEPGVDSGLTFEATSTYWSNGLLVFVTPENW
jgi:hypothetical protein